MRVIILGPKYMYLCTMYRANEKGQRGHLSLHFQKCGAQVGLCATPTFCQKKCFNFAICSYFVANYKNEKKKKIQIFFARFACRLYIY